MTKIKQVNGDIHLNQDLDYQRRSWKVQRVGWVAMGLVALAALLGLFGSGPLSSATTGGKGDSLQLEYKRFGRFEASTRLRIHIQPGVEREGQVRVWLNRNYVEGVQIQKVIPEPERVEAEPDRLTYVFRTANLNQPTAVTFYLQTQQVGLLSGQVGLAQKQPLSFSQFIYP